MYNKLFQKILDSSIWLEADTTRIVWFTFLAAMDQDGYVQFASAANVAHRARVSLDAAKAAVTLLESPDEFSSDPEHEGRRIERVDGGWMVLNAPKYALLVTRAVARENTRNRVKKHREAKRNVTSDTGGNGESGQGNTKAGKCNAPVTPSDADAEIDAEIEGRERSRSHDLAVTIQPETKVKSGLGMSTPQSSLSPLVNGAALREHATHAWCSLPREGLCVLHTQHREMLGKSAKPEIELRAWYAATVARFEGQAVGDDRFTFWRNEFAGWIGTVTAKPAAPGKTGSILAAGRAVIARQLAQKAIVDGK